MCAVLCGFGVKLRVIFTERFRFFHRNDFGFRWTFARSRVRSRTEETRPVLPICYNIETGRRIRVPGLEHG